MDNHGSTVKLGRGSQLIEVPQRMWEGHLAGASQHTETRLKFMTPDHHRVRYFVVEEIARIGQPLPAIEISHQLDLNISQVQTILDELERNLFFLVRDEQGSVQWAYPVTAAKTPHRIILDSGERLYGA